jgi:hypothetical protein
MSAGRKPGGVLAKSGGQCPDVRTQANSTLETPPPHREIGQRRQAVGHATGTPSSQAPKQRRKDNQINGLSCEKESG